MAASCVTYPDNGHSNSSCVSAVMFLQKIRCEAALLFTATIFDR